MDMELSRKISKSANQCNAVISAIALLLSLVITCPSLADITGRVVSVTDGDTIKVVDANRKQHKVRLTGIDAPEKNQPYGKASRKHLASLVSGKQVRVESNKSDRYGRVLGKVWVDDTDANLEQLKAGYAWWYKYYRKDQPRADRKVYSKAEKDARKAELGLWADPNPINPYDWRKGQR